MKRGLLFLLLFTVMGTSKADASDFTDTIRGFDELIANTEEYGSDIDREFDSLPPVSGTVTADGLTACTVVTDGTGETWAQEAEATDIEETLREPDSIYAAFNRDEVSLLMRTVETETHGADYIQKRNVASVVLNRHRVYGKSLISIIKSPHQFAYSKTNITPETIRACEDALHDRGDVKDALYFRSGARREVFNGQSLKHYDGCHYFY